MAASRRFFGKRPAKAGSTCSKERMHEEVVKLAYQLYEERGCEAGHELEDWLKAEALVKERETASTH